jgi:DNA-binding protein H-NS
VTSSLAWRPFDTRFGDLLDQIAFHQSLVRDELDLARTISLNHSEEAAKKEQALAEKEREQAERSRRRIEDIQKCTASIRETLEWESEGTNYTSPKRRSISL